MPKSIFAISIVTILICINISCMDESIQTKPAIQVTVLEVGATEAWLRVVRNIAGTTTLVRDNTVHVCTLSGVGDTIVDDQLLIPNNRYKYTATNNSLSAVTVSSSQLLTTLDTTSNDIDWQSYIFGDTLVGNSYFQSVDFVNDNSFWAGGEINFEDSLGQVKLPRNNLVKFQNDSIEIESIKFSGLFGLAYNDIHSVKAFNNNAVLISAGFNVKLWTGTGWQDFGHIWQGDTALGDAYHLWGTSIHNIYGGGRNGSILHYSQSAWKTLNSPTTDFISDLWGFTSSSNTIVTVYCPVNNYFADPPEFKLLRIRNDSVETFLDDENNKEIASVWSNKGQALFACGEGVFEYKNNQWNTIDVGVHDFYDRIRGTNLNNIFVIGNYGCIVHYNGVRWKIISMPRSNNDNYWDLAVRNNKVVIVGGHGSKALVVIGTQH